MADYSIALWGPTSSGKTWFIHAFAKKLMEYADDKDFAYILEDRETDSRVPAQPPEIKGTQEIRDISWVFRREPKLQTEAHSISAYEHVINMRDDKGANVFNIDDYNNEMSRENVVSSDYLLVMLDPTSLDLAMPNNSNEQRQPAKRSDEIVTPKIEGGIGGEQVVNNVDFSGRDELDGKAQISRQDYAKKVQLLFETLAKKNKQYRIAICIAKIDQIGARYRDPWDLIRIYFGKDMHTFLKQYASMPQFKIETFSVSAFGFLKSSTKVEANYVVGDKGGQLKNRDGWEPYNVEAPLFWLFEEVERSRLENPSSGVLGKNIFGKERISKYIGYRINRR